MLELGSGSGLKMPVGYETLGYEKVWVRDVGKASVCPGLKQRGTDEEFHSSLLKLCHIFFVKITICLILPINETVRRRSEVE